MSMIALTAVAIGTAAAWLAFCPPRSVLDRVAEWTQGRVLFYANAPKPINDRIPVFLTIDDAPTPHTHHILEALEECGQGKALFFVIGEYANANPQCLQAIVQAGHALGNHDAHDRMTAKQTPRDIKEGIQSCTATIEKVLGASPTSTPTAPIRYFRPGSGLFTRSMLDVVDSFGYITLLGDVYGHDCQLSFAPSFLKWFYTKRVQAGSIVILHDGTERRAKNSAAVIRALYANANVEFVPLPYVLSAVRVARSKL